MRSMHYYMWYIEYLYAGAEKMADHIQFMTGYYPNRWLQFCWKFISPLLILVSLQSLLSY